MQHTMTSHCKGFGSVYIGIVAHEVLEQQFASCSYVDDCIMQITPFTMAWQYTYFTSVANFTFASNKAVAMSS